MINFFKQPFGFKPILTKDDLNRKVTTTVGRDGKPVNRKANDMWGTLKRLWKFISHEPKLLIVIVLFVIGVALLSIA